MSGTLSRRTFLTGTTGGTVAIWLSACTGDQQSSLSRPMGGDPWQRFAGTTINFISENTAPTAAIAANLKPFTDLTGITVKIVNLELQALVQRVALDLAGGQAQYDVIYADPYQVLAPYSRGLVDLRDFLEDPQFPTGELPFRRAPVHVSNSGILGIE